MIHLNHADTSDIRRCPVGPHTTSDIHPIVYRVAIGEVDKVEEGVHIVHRPDHLSVLGIGSRSAHWKGDLAAGIGDREPHGLRGSSGGEGRWIIGDLKPENLTFANVVGLGQELNRVNLCKKRSIYALRNQRETNTPLPALSQAWNQVRVPTGIGGSSGRNNEPRT